MLYDIVLRALDRSRLDAQGARQAFASILQFCTDPQPKIRKKATEVVPNVISHHNSSLVQHQYGERAAEWAKAQLTETSTKPAETRKGEADRSRSSGRSDLCVAGLIARYPLPSSYSPLLELTTLVLHIPILGSNFLCSAVYHISTDIFRLPFDDDVRDVGAQVLNDLAAVLAYSPMRPISAPLPNGCMLWAATCALHAIVPGACAKELTYVWKVVWRSHDSDGSCVCRFAAQALDDLAACLAPEFTEPALLAFPDVALLFSIAPSLLVNLQCRPAPGPPTAAQILMMPMIKHIGDLRPQKDLEYKEAMDSALSTAMRVLGPSALLDTLPLSLEPEDRYFVLLSEHMFDLQQKAETAGRSSEAKVWIVLAAQAWAGLSSH